MMSIKKLWQSIYTAVNREQDGRRQPGGGGGVMSITIKRLDSGYYRISGDGICEWCQPPAWPCADEDVLDRSFFPEASSDFRREVKLANLKALETAILERE